MPAAALRQIKQEDIVCPAGSAIGDVGNWCGVERAPIDGHLDPRSLEGFCCGNYQACPSWRAEKQRIWEAKRNIRDVLPEGEPE